MKQYELYLIRHGRAEEQSATGHDKDRVLSKEGVTRLQQSSAMLSRLIKQPDTMICSPYARAQQTAQVLRSTIPIWSDANLSTSKELIPYADPCFILHELIVTPGSRIVLFGHCPYLPLLASKLLVPSLYTLDFALSRGGVMAFSVIQESVQVWRARLLWMANPTLLGVQ